MRRSTRKLNLSRLLAALLALGILLCGIPFVSAAEAEGSCGDSLTWLLEAGTLTISGSGYMTDFTEPDMAPWYAYREEIIRLELPDGLRSIGELAFYGCKNLQTVVIPDTVSVIGEYAFAECSGMQLLRLSKRLVIIAEAAFYGCSGLPAVVLPETLEVIGEKAFYMCQGLTGIVIPDRVTDLGKAVFAYCTGLIRAQVGSGISVLPEWTFYHCTSLTTVLLPESVLGAKEYVFRSCDQLTSVYYSGDSRTREEIEDILISEVPGFENGGFVSDSADSGSASGTVITQNPDGSYTSSTVTVTPGTSSSVSSGVTHNHPAEDMSQGSRDMEITVTIEEESGWEESTALVDKLLQSVGKDVADGKDYDQVSLTVYVKDGQVDQKFIDTLAGRDVQLTVVTQNGSQWKIDCGALARTGQSYACDLDYDLSLATQEQCQRLGATGGFLLRFAADAEVNSEVIVRLPAPYARQNAVLFQDNDGLEECQAVKVDGNGVAHFYLAAVSADMDYYIAFGVERKNDTDVIIPNELAGEYGGEIERFQPIQYQITGRTSSWGVGVGQVTWILAGVMGGTVVLVGIIMFALNKRRLKAGYVPELYDDEDDE